MMKILKNDLKSLVETEENKFAMIEANNLHPTQIEVLPDLLPVYAKIPCNGLRTPCRLEIQIGKLGGLLVLASNIHKYPKEDDHQFERDKLILAKGYKAKEIKFDLKGENNNKKKSLIMLEALANGQVLPIKPDSAPVKQAPAGAKLSKSDLIFQGEKSKIFMFQKAGFDDSFGQDDFLYLSFLSQSGGTIRIRALFPNQQGQYGVE